MLPAGHVLSRPVRHLVTAAAAAVLLLTLTHPASAHVHLVGSSPAANETLAQVPTEVVVAFDGPVELPPQGGLQLWVGDQEVAITPALDESRTQVRAALPDGVPAGTHRVAWRIVASDSHVEEGEFSYVVEAAADPTPTGAEPAAATDDEPGATATEDAPIDAAPTEAGLAADTAAADAEGSGGGSTIPVVVALLVAAALAAVLLLRGGRTDADA